MVWAERRWNFRWSDDDLKNSHRNCASKLWSSTQKNFLLHPSSLLPPCYCSFLNNKTHNISHFYSVSWSCECSCYRQTSDSPTASTDFSREVDSHKMCWKTEPRPTYKVIFRRKWNYFHFFLLARRRRLPPWSTLESRTHRKSWTKGSKKKKLQISFH